MNVGIIGAGNIGQAAAARLVSAGHNVLISNSRGPASLEPLVASLGPSATAGSAGDAAKFGDVVLVATPLNAIGKLRHGRRQEPGTPVYNQPLDAKGVAQALKQTIT